MFGNNYELMPRTYSIKSYKKREALNFKKFIKYFFLVLIILAILVISVLSAVHLI